MSVSALAGTISAPFAARTGGIDAARWLRSALSLLVAIGILAVALPVAFGSGARGAGVDPVQVFSSGSLVAAQTSGGAQLSVEGLIPGQSRSATIRVANSGAAPAAFSVAARVADTAGAGGAPLSGALALRVEPAGAGSQLYSGPIGGMPRLALGSIAAGATRVYRFTVTLPRNAGNAIEGSALGADFVWASA
ncbi:MAG TPA: hypothetical protein VHR65_03255 [Solirubrobacterales bacterium]|nr:hypothetical protein [Solirubrobacterales bacterium]